MIPVHGQGEMHARLGWLIRLRWMALVGVSVAAGVAVAGIVPGLNLWVVGAAVTLGLLTNAFFWTQVRRGKGDDEAAVWQALLDTGALTLVIWAAGGADCPFLGFYIFPMLLAALLAGRAALWPTGMATAFGVGFQYAAAHIEVMRVGAWDPPQPWADLLHVVAVVFTVGMAAYFALRFTEALRAQVRARREADTLLSTAVDGLHAGLEVVERGQVTWQNPEAARLVGERVDRPWVCPARADGRCTTGAEACHPTGPGRAAPNCQFAQTGDGPDQLFEMLAFPLPRGARFMAMYIDRTAEIAARQKLMLTERLASLGRTVQGVAHELNTPLATIQTLGRDLLDALTVAELPAALRADLDESADMIVAEVQRCRRITHALLGRAEHLDARTGDAPH